MHKDEDIIFGHITPWSYHTLNPFIHVGKSTSLLALMGFIPITSGRVCVGDVDVQELPLAVLRGAAAVVPQEAVIFQGTFRQNLDPKGEFEYVVYGISYIPKPKG